MVVVSFDVISRSILGCHVAFAVICFVLQRLVLLRNPDPGSTVAN